MHNKSVKISAAALAAVITFGIVLNVSDVYGSSGSCSPEFTSGVISDIISPGSSDSADSDVPMTELVNFMEMPADPAMITPPIDRTAASATLSVIGDTDSPVLWNTTYALSEQAAADVQASIDNYTRQGKTCGFVMLDLTTGQALSYRAAQVYYSASSIKDPYVFSLLAAGTAPDNHMTQTIARSSNTDYAWIRNHYGKQVFADWLADTGVPVSQANTRYIYTSALELARMWAKGYDVLSSADGNGAWARQQFQVGFNSAIKASLSSMNVTYSKAGWIALKSPRTKKYYSVYNDAGVVCDGANPYIIAVMSDFPSTAGFDEAEQLDYALQEVHFEMMQDWSAKLAAASGTNTVTE